ncbi:MAG: hypothetical protein AVDCRST_MAG27-387, partial [uncultured Craurococcus sp.]
ARHPRRRTAHRPRAGARFAARRLAPLALGRRARPRRADRPAAGACAVRRGGGPARRDAAARLPARPLDRTPPL